MVHEIRTPKLKEFADWAKKNISGDEKGEAQIFSRPIIPGIRPKRIVRRWRKAGIPNAQMLALKLGRFFPDQCDELITALSTMGIAP